MNRAYRERFGFPFIMAVKGERPDEIMAAFEARLRDPAAEERAETVRQVERILPLRLQDRLAGA